MRAIFISYRRDDTEGQAGRLFQQLRESFGEDMVFMDVATIEPGVDFRKAIEKNTAACGVLLALIGRDWVSLTDAEGHRRLDNPDDFVRLETASALRRDIPVIPVLVQGASMPRADELPTDLKDLAYRNSVELTHARWDSDVALLVKALQPFTRVEPQPDPRGKTLHPSSTQLAAGAVFALALAAGGWAMYGRQTAPQIPQLELREAAGASETVNKSPVELQQSASTRTDTAEADAAAIAASKAKAVATAKAAAQAKAKAAADAQAKADADAKARADADARATTAALALQQAAADKVAADKLAAEKAAADNAAANVTQVQAHRDGICITGFVWREAGPGDKVCVTPQLRAQAGAENRTASANRQPGGGPYGPNTCREGFVWREAVANDVVCVVPGSRRQALADNAAAASRVVPLPQTIRR